MSRKTIENKPKNKKIHSNLRSFLLRMSVSLRLIETSILNKSQRGNSTDVPWKFADSY